MSDDKIQITFTCKDCGGKILSLPDDYTDDSIAVCKSCGKEFGRFGDIKAAAIQKAKEDVQKQLGDMMRKAGWKVERK